MMKQKSLFHDQPPTLEEVMSAWDLTRPTWLSRAQIAIQLGRSKSPTLIATIRVAVTLGYLTEKNEVLPNGSDYFLYQPSEKWINTEYPF